MFRGYWIAAIALGLGVASALAQDAARVPGESPSISENQTGNTDSTNYSTRPLGVPVTIIETPEQAAHSSEREAKSDQHEAADLNAQVRAANAAERAAATAERQEVPAWAQIFIGFVATFIAVIALVVSIWTALRADATARAQLRAYVHVAVEVAPQIDHFEIKVTGTNHGQTPAYNVRAAVGWTDEPFDPSIHVVDAPEQQSRGSVGPGAVLFMHVLTNQSHIPERRLTPDQCTAIRVGDAELHVYGRVDYEDAFRTTRWVTFRHRLERKGNRMTLSVTKEGNDSK